MVKKKTIYLALAAVLVSSWSAVAAGDDGTIYRADSQYALRLGDRTVDDAEILYSVRNVSYLVISDELDHPLVLSIAKESVVAISPEAIEMNELEGIARVSPEASEGKAGGLERRRGEIRFQLGEVSAALMPAAPLVGWHTPQTLRAKYLALRSGYARAEKSDIQAKSLAIPVDQEILVEVFFSSLDEYSQQVMPGIMRLEEELSSSSIVFRYYGLPRRFVDDPVGKERAIHGVPTLVVTADGQELGRLVGRALQKPSTPFARLLSQ